MFSFAILVGIYSYLIYILGLAGLLYRGNIFILTFLLLIFIYFPYKRKLRFSSSKFFFTLRKNGRLSLFFLVLIILQAAINLIGALGPELSFDALWYHLTLPKLYLVNHSIGYISGGLLYYSAMPKLTEMLYVAGLAFGNEIFPKLTHFLFGILCLVALYKLSRKFLDYKFALLTCVVFYSNLVVGWQSTTAYVDLARTFFEIMALWGFINWLEKGEKKWLVESAIMLGLAISTKLLTIGSLLIFTILITVYFLKNKNLKHLFIGLFVYWIICLLIPLPWFILSFISTGNPVYPFFENIYPVKFTFNFINPLNLSDPISPLYFVLVPIGFLLFNKQSSKLKVISIYSILAFLVWQLTPNTGGGRFILPYLPVFSILSVWVVQKLWKLKIRYVFIGLIIFFSIFSIFYRLGANLKYIPVLIGQQSKKDFLSKNLNFSFGDFYDVDGFFERKIKDDDKVLLYGFHNLYYVNFPFIDSSWVKKGDMFNYVAVQDSKTPSRFKNWNLTYYNHKTKVKLYSLGGIKWTY